MDFRTPRGWRQAAAFALYIPLLGALSYLTAVAGWHLTRGRPFGFLGIPAGIALGLLARRALHIGHGETSEVSLDLVLVGAVDAVGLAVALLAR